MNKIWRYPQVGHFALAFGSSWGGIFIVLSVTGFSLATLRPIDTSVVFVLMLLGVDTDDDVAVEPIVGQRILAVIAGLALLGALLALFIAGQNEVVTGTHSATAAISDDLSNIAQLGRTIFTTWIFAFEITAGLLTIAVIGAVVLSRRPDSYEPIPEPESMDDDTAEELA